DAKLAAIAYKNYLWAFPKSRYRGIMRLNLAETQFKLKHWVEAGKNYEELGGIFRSPKKKKSFYDSSLQAYSEALKTPKDLSRLELVEARNGIRSIGRVFIKYYKKDKAIPSIRFVIGRTYYDERDFPRAVKSFEDYLKFHPNGADVQLAVDLILDSFNQREDYDGLISIGQRLSKNTRLSKGIRDNVSEIVKQAQFKKIQAESGDYSSPSYTKNLLKFAAKYKGSDLGDQALYEAFTQLKSKKDPRAYVPGEQLLLKYGSSKYAKEVVNQMGQMALVTADFRRAAKYFEAFFQRYPNEAQAKDLMQQAAMFREYMGDFKDSADDYSRLGNAEGVARSHFLGANWRDLVVSSSRVGGVMGAYWSGLSRYRIGNVNDAIPYLQRAATSGAGTFEEKSAAAHSLFLIATQATNAYKAVQIKAGQEAQAVQQKAQMLKNLEGQMNKVIQFGNGRWTIAALYTMGVVNDEFGRFILNSPNPPGISGATLKQFRAALSAEAKKYQTNASNYFKQCLSTGEKFEVFTQFMKGCLSSGKVAIDETQETRVRLRASESTPPQADAIRSKLYDDTRNTDLLIKLSESYTQVSDYSMAVLVLQRASEVAKRDSRVIALKGLNYLFMNELEKAKQEYTEALKVNGNDPTALWGMSALYKEFGFKSKYSSTVSRAKRAGRPLGRIHPFIQAIL
ncbi:MAG: hypothetical protein KDD25_02485, partial [Bdellovibrionales bacterium]|nr:hypothetical protein [Bdellovibrionales bacterium]